MSYISAKETITKLVDARLILMRNYRVFNGLTFENISDLQMAIKKVDSPLSFAVFITDFWTTIHLLPSLLDSQERSQLTIMLEKAKTLIESNSKN